MARRSMGNRSNNRKRAPKKPQQQQRRQLLDHGRKEVQPAVRREQSPPSAQLKQQQSPEVRGAEASRSGASSSSASSKVGSSGNIKQLDNYGDDDDDIITPDDADDIEGDDESPNRSLERSGLEVVEPKPQVVCNHQTIAMDECGTFQHRAGAQNEYHSHHCVTQPRPAQPIIILSPRGNETDDSLSCDCRNCQFFSGWCCMPCLLFIIVFIILAWLCLRNGESEQESVGTSNLSASW